MKKLFIAIFVASFLVAGTASAQIGMMRFWPGNNSATRQNPSTDIDTALQDIYKAQNVSSRSKIDCSKVTDDQFEKLGDAVMGYGISEQQHTAMEQMMGGEGSATLKQAHITMGRSYLGCWANYNSGPVRRPMMEYYGLSNGQPVNYFSSGGMMGWSSTVGGYYWTGWITTALIWILLILFIAALVRWLKKTKQK